jgi:ribosomal protein L11 methyltransferase
LASYPALDLRFTLSPDTTPLHDLLYAELDAFEPIAIHPHETADGWLVFFRSPARRDDARAALLVVLGTRLESVHAVEVEDEDWARRSQANLKAVRAGRILVTPPWDPAATGATPGSPTAPNTDTDIVIIIEPSMGFGTGHHATTRLCLELLQEADVSGRRVIDVGTGSGVLALAAWKLGAASVVALDHDPDALQNARENVVRNGGDARIEIREADLGDLALQPADIVLANLTGAVLQRFALTLRSLAAPDGVLIVSGFSPDELPAVVTALDAVVVHDRHDGEWCAATLTL